MGCDWAGLLVQLDCCLVGQEILGFADQTVSFDFPNLHQTVNLYFIVSMHLPFDFIFVFFSAAILEYTSYGIGLSQIFFCRINKLENQQIGKNPLKDSIKFP